MIRAPRSVLDRHATAVKVSGVLCVTHDPPARRHLFWKLSKGAALLDWDLRLIQCRRRNVQRRVIVWYEYKVSAAMDGFGFPGARIISFADLIFASRQANAMRPAYADITAKTATELLGNLAGR